jgi:hypothetical protein
LQFLENSGKNVMKKWIIITSAILLVTLTAWFVQACRQEYTQSELVARTFLQETPTFSFSGVKDTIELVNTETIKFPYRLEFTYQFQSDRSGYGNRTGMELAQEINTYQANITVDQSRVIRATINGCWSVLGQRYTGEPI